MVMLLFHFFFTLLKSTVITCRRTVWETAIYWLYSTRSDPHHHHVPAHPPPTDIQHPLKESLSRVLDFSSKEECRRLLVEIHKKLIGSTAFSIVDPG